MLDEGRAQLIADGGGVPVSATEHILEAIRGRLAAHFRHWPAVLSLRLAEPALQIGPGALPGRRTGELGHQPPRHIRHVGPTTLDGADRRIGRGRAGKFACGSARWPGFVLLRCVRNQDTSFKILLPL